MARDGNLATPSTPDIVADDEELNRWFEDDFQDGKLTSGPFKAKLVSVFRNQYRSVAEIVAPEKASTLHVIYQIATTFVRELSLDVVKDEPPFAHAHVERRDQEIPLSLSVARKVRDEAMKIVRMSSPRKP